MADNLNILFDELVALISQAVPKAGKVSKYGGTIFTL
jgi:hypothetical protein